jgi:hypothetical protein
VAALQLQQHEQLAVMQVQQDEHAQQVQFHQQQQQHALELQNLQMHAQQNMHHVHPLHYGQLNLGQAHPHGPVNNWMAPNGIGMIPDLPNVIMMINAAIHGVAIGDASSIGGIAEPPLVMPTYRRHRLTIFSQVNGNIVPGQN